MSLVVVVFDFDGVLVDSNAIKTQAYEAVFEAFADGQPLPLSQIRETVQKGRDRDRYFIVAEVTRQISMSVPELGLALSGKYEAICEAYGRYCDEAVAVAPEIRGASEALRDLRPHFSLYVNSATPDMALHRALRARGIADFFSGVYGSASSKEDNLRRVLALHRARPEQMVFVGDAPQDREAADRVGCTFVGIENDSNSFAADSDIASFQDLRPLSLFLMGTRGNTAGRK